MSRYRVGVVAAVVLAAGACSGSGSSESQVDLDDDAVVQYRYQDSSVPPEHHRSYSLTIERDEAHAVVDSYGDVIGEATVPVSEAEWDDLVTAVEDAASLSSDDDQIEPGCVGGRGRSLTVTSGDEVVVDISLYLCRDSDGEMVNVEQASRLDEAVAPVIASFPDWHELLDRG